MFPCAMKSKVFTSNCGGCIGGSTSHPIVLTMVKELKLSSLTYGTIGTNACICFHGDSFVCGKFTVTGWLACGRGGWCPNTRCGLSICPLPYPCGL